ncbi:serine hydrolase [Thorsellia anophelis]|nr:serine hydrolase [Thorsellia anophelis]
MQLNKNRKYNKAKILKQLCVFAALHVTSLFITVSAVANTESNVALTTTQPIATALIEAPVIEAKAYILMDANNGQVLAQSNADERLAPASLTKIMTSYVIGQFLANNKIGQDDVVTISQNAWVRGNPALKGSSLMFLEPNQKVSVLDLNLGLVVQSGNDAAIALAEYISGTQEAFIDLMNQYAQQLKLQNTHFKTVHGLDMDGQYSTARDMALLSQALINHLPEEYALNKIKEFTYGGIRQENRNRLLWSKTLNVDGLKTGHTSGAGYNLVSSAYNETGMRLIAVVFGTESDKKRFDESEKLLSWGFRTFESLPVLKANQPLLTQKVWFGDVSEVQLGLVEDAVVTFPRGQANQLKATQTLDYPNLEAPLAQNQVVGKVTIRLGEQIVSEQPLVVLTPVEPGGFFSRLWDFIVLKVSSWF